jgi:alkaline phosphatase D
MRSNSFYRGLLLIATSLAVISVRGIEPPNPDGGGRAIHVKDTLVYIAQGVMAGEITDHSVILQTRLTATPEPVNGDVPGKKGIARMVLDLDSTFQHPRFTGWKVSDSLSDYILRWSADTLQPHTRYYYRLEYGAHCNFTRLGKTGRFSTLPGPDSDDSISFVVVTGMNFAKFYYGEKGTPEKSSDGAAEGMDQALGFPALETITSIAPDFFVGTGDNVYYDDPYGPWAATTVTGMRKKWHELFAQPRFINMFLKVPTLWEKDDHDHRFNDCDTTGDEEPSNQVGKRIFLEQMPVTMDIRNESSTSRTIRVNRHLQIWLVEGRDYRSPNSLPDGPEKSLWGAVQKEWLKKSILDSDATFKILISPTPMVGPDDAYKSDNHTNQKGFRTEGEAFFKWMDENQIPRDQFFIVCGDRHWQYHARHPSGYEEFSTGALVDANSRAGRLAGDPKSTDPDSLIHQYFVQGPGQASGGFLNIRQITVQDVPKLIFTFYDEHGKLNYSATINN